MKENCTIVGKEYSGSALATELGTAISGNIELDARTTLLGTTKKVVLWASKVISGDPATVNVMAIDTCGRGASFDPVITTLEVTAGGQVQQRFAGILAAERYLRVINGSPGLTKLEVVINGYTFRLDSLVAGQTVAADLGAAMHEGDANVVVLIGYGEAGTGERFDAVARAGGTGVGPRGQAVGAHMARGVDRLGTAIQREPPR